MRKNNKTIMRFGKWMLWAILLAVPGCTFLGHEDDGKKSGKDVSLSPSDAWTQDFGLGKRSLAATGENRYFVLKPGFQQVFEGKKEKLVITVLDETKRIGEVTTRVVEEREEKNGKLVEVSRNFFAICKETGDVFYFGEEVDDYKDGKVVGHSGAWRADEKNYKAGMMMPGAPSVGAKYYQEIAPGEALDRAEIVRLNETLKTPAGTFKNCLKTEETSGLSPREKEYKTYAPGVGLIQDADFLLTRYGFAKK